MTDVRELHGPELTNAAGYFCPQCQNPVEVPMSLLGAPVNVHCSCGWSGVHTQLLRTEFKHGFKSDEEIAETMVRDLRNLLAKTAAQSYGAFLLKWGFMSRVSGLQLATYIEAIARATVKAIIETRKSLLEETARGAGIPRSSRG